MHNDHPFNQACVFLKLYSCTCLARPQVGKKILHQSITYCQSHLGKIKPYFLSLNIYVSFFSRKPCYGGQILGDIFPCLSAEAVGQGSGTLAHNMENLSKESNTNAPSQNILITIILAASLKLPTENSLQSCDFSPGTSLLWSYGQQV